MRPFRPLALCCVLLAPMPAATSEPVRVRSGEHTDFSRLVLEFPERPAWIVEQDGSLVALTFMPGAWSFDTRDVFRLIPRGRIRDVFQGKDDTISIELGCDCAIDVFPVRESAVAIDVGDGPPGISLAGIRLTVGEDGPDLPEPLVGSMGPGPFVGPPLPQPISSGGMPRQIVEPPSPGEPGSTHPHTEASLDTPPSRDGVNPPQAHHDESRLTRALSQEIGRAASMGILETLRPARQAEPTAGPDTLTDTTTGMPGLLLRSPESPGTSLSDALPERIDTMRCPAREALDVGSWFPAEVEPGDALAIARSNLFDELDRTDVQAAVELARLYIAFGFGAEAANVLTELAPDHPDKEYLAPLAALIDGAEGDAGIGPLRDCPGRAQLWALLAGPKSVPKDPEAVLVALSELPLHLRRLLAPRVATAFADHGETAAAESARQLVARAAGPHGSAVEIWEARDGAAEGRPGAKRMLADLARGGSPVSAEALASLLELNLEANRPSGEQFLELAEARAYELRGSDLGHRLSAAVVRARLADGEFGAAFERLKAYRDLLPTELNSALSNDFYLFLANGGEEGDLLRYAAGALESDIDAPQPDTALRLAERLLDLGFASLASRYLRSIPDSPAARVLLARAALVSGDASAALSFVQDVADDRATAIRAESLAALGRHGEATDLFRQLGEMPEAMSSLWRSGNWERIADESNEVRSRAAELAGSDAPPPGDLLDLLERSADARTRLMALFESTPLP